MVHHGGVRADFCITVVGVHWIPLERQVNEAVRILLSCADCVMNSNNERHQAPGYQKALERGNSVPRPKGLLEANKVKLSSVLSQN